jgi:hypothetical protein
MHYSIYDFAGNIGVALIIITYLLLQLGRMNSTDISYSLFNATGALLIVFSLLQQFNLSAFIVETFWFFISILGIIRFIRNKNN